VYRIHAADKNALDMEASKNFGGRWNKANRFGALYASLTKETAQAEHASQVLKRGLTPGDLSPRLMTTIRVHLTKVLDLTDTDRQEEFGITKSELESDEDAYRKKILEVSEKAWAEGFEAILSPSARLLGGKNLNIFPDKLNPKSFLRIIKSERLRVKTGNS
jgi:RES domain-containing protein